MYTFNSNTNNNFTNLITKYTNKHMLLKKYTLKKVLYNFIITFCNFFFFLVFEIDFTLLVKLLQNYQILY